MLLLAGSTTTSKTLEPPPGHEEMNSHSDEEDSSPPKDLPTVPPKLGRKGSWITRRINLVRGTSANEDDIKRVGSSDSVPPTAELSTDLAGMQSPLPVKKR